MQSMHWNQDCIINLYVDILFQILYIFVHTAQSALMNVAACASYILVTALFQLKFNL